MDPLDTSLKIAGSGLAAQSARLRVISENMANAQSTGRTPGSDPYSRKTITFVNELDRVSGANLVRVDNIGADQALSVSSMIPGIPRRIPMEM